MATTRSHPQILLMGMRRSGKTSLLQVLHHHLPPNDTLYLDSTLRPYPTTLRPWSPVTIWDGITPQAPLSHAARDGNVIPDTPGGPLPWSSVKAVIWVIDAQDDYLLSLSQLHSLILVAYANNPRVHFHVFLHKMDGLSEDYRDDTQTDVEKRIEDDLTDASSSFAFARGVETPRRDSDGFVIDEEAEAANSKVDWDKLEKEVAARAAGSAASETAIPTPPTPTAASSRSREKFSGGTLRRRRPSSAKSSSNGHGSGSAIVSLESEVRLSLHQTSIFDASLFVAFSRVLQDLVLASPGNILRGALNRLIDGFVDSCAPRAEGSVSLPTAAGKDVALPSSSTPPAPAGEVPASSAAGPSTGSTTSPTASSALLVEKLYLLDLPTRTYLASDSSPFDKTTFQVVCDYLGFLVSLSGLFANLKPDSKRGDDKAGHSQQEGKKTWPSSTLRLASMTAGVQSSGTGGDASVAARNDEAPGSPALAAVGGAAGGSGGGEGGSGSTGAKAGAEEELRLCFWQLDQRLALVGVISAQQQQQQQAKARGGTSTADHRPVSREGEQDEEEDEDAQKEGEETATIPGAGEQEGTKDHSRASAAASAAAAAPRDASEELVQHNVDVFRRAIAALLEATTLVAAPAAAAAALSQGGEQKRAGAPGEVAKQLWRSSGIDADVDVQA